MGTGILLIVGTVLVWREPGRPALGWVVAALALYVVAFGSATWALVAYVRGR
jgi:hypothetical protein